MYGILGEDSSDVRTLTVLVRKLAGDEGLRVKCRGYDGCGEMLNRGARQLKLFRDLGCGHFIVCHDADGSDPKPKEKLVRERIIIPSGLGDQCCIVIPVQELEAWILADIECATQIFSSWKPSPIPNPEKIKSPKEHLEKLSRQANHKPRYSHAMHNEKMARNLDLAKVKQKCPAFRVLAGFVERRAIAG